MSKKTTDQQTEAKKPFDLSDDEMGKVQGGSSFNATSLIGYDVLDESEKARAAQPESAFDSSWNVTQNKKA